MAILRTILTIIYIVVSVAIVFVVLSQEGKQAGLSGSINGMADTYWGKNKGRSVEGGLVLATKCLGIAFIVISFLLNLKW